MVIVNIFIRILNGLLSIVGSIIELILMVFPNTPFHISLPQEFEEIIGVANYFVPVAQLVAIGQLWLVSIGIFYAYSVYARWSKTIS